MRPIRLVEDPGYYGRMWPNGAAVRKMQSENVADAQMRGRTGRRLKHADSARERSILAQHVEQVVIHPAIGIMGGNVGDAVERAKAFDVRGLDTA